MLWLKRNMFLAVSGFIALLLTVFGSYYLLTSKSKSNAMEEELNNLKNRMNKIYSMKPFPDSTNIVAAQEQVKVSQDALIEARAHFTPVPFGNVTGQAFKAVLDNTIYELTSKAKASNVELPRDDYAFCFAAQKAKLKLAPESFPAITEQLSEVKAICNTLFDARIHSLIGLRRVKVSSDDPPGEIDYRDDWTFETNTVSQAVIHPYEVSFTCFSSELARVMEAFAASPHGFIIRSVAVDRFSEEGKEAAGRNVQPGRRGVPVIPRGNRPRGSRVAAPAARNPNENETILNEERFLTVLWVAVVNPAQPKEQL
jgi:hypothetical protein